MALKSDKEIFKLKVLYRSNLILAVSLHRCKCKLIIQRLDLWTLPFYGRRYFADLRMTFHQKYFLQDWFRNGVGLGLELVFGIGLVFVKPLLRYVLSLWGQRNNLLPRLWWVHVKCVEEIKLIEMHDLKRTHLDKCMMFSGLFQWCALLWKGSFIWLISKSTSTFYASFGNWNSFSTNSICEYHHNFPKLIWARATILAFNLNTGAHF
jgi:hypothetical protein